jgi:hypothetical protein
VLAAPEAAKNELGELVRKLHCYVVFTDHAGACQAKRILQLTEQTAVLAGSADVMRVRFCKPQNVTALCTPAFRAFVTAQWAQSAVVAKASPEYKKALCRVSALFVSSCGCDIGNDSSVCTTLQLPPPRQQWQPTRAGQPVIINGGTCCMSTAGCLDCTCNIAGHPFFPRIICLTTYVVHLLHLVAFAVMYTAAVVGRERAVLPRCRS